MTSKKEPSKYKKKEKKPTNIFQEFAAKTEEFFTAVGEKTEEFVVNTQNKIKEFSDNIKKNIKKDRKKRYKKAYNSLGDYYDKHPEERARLDYENKDVKKIKQDTTKLQKTVKETKEELIGTKQELTEIKEELIETKEDIKNIIKSQMDLLLKHYSEDLKRDPLKYEGLLEKDLKGLINTKIWKDNEEELVNEYFNETFSKLNTKSKEELIFLKIILNLMDTGFDTCVFLLTKIVERELKVKILEEFKQYWITVLNRKDYPIVNREDQKSRHVWEIKKTHEIMINYLNNDGNIVLGNIYYFFRELSDYCRKGKDKLINLGWEEDFMSLFGEEFCPALHRILDSFKTEISTNDISTELIKLRNLVAHPDKQAEKMDFNKEFIERFLDFLTTDEPHLLKIICDINPKENREESENI